MSGLFIAYGIVSYIFSIIFCGWLASEKGRSVGSWVLLGIFLPGIALIAAAGAPDNNPTVDYSRIATARGPEKTYWENLQCPICHEQRDSMESLTSHMKFAHPNAKPE